MSFRELESGEFFTHSGRAQLYYFSLLTFLSQMTERAYQRAKLLSVKTITGAQDETKRVWYLPCSKYIGQAWSGHFLILNCEILFCYFSDKKVRFKLEDVCILFKVTYQVHKGAWTLTYCFDIKTAAYIFIPHCLSVCINYQKP